MMHAVNGNGRMFPGDMNDAFNPQQLTGVSDLQCVQPCCERPILDRLVDTERETLDVVRMGVRMSRGQR